MKHNSHELLWSVQWQLSNQQWATSIPPHRPASTLQTTTPSEMRILLLELSHPGKYIAATMAFTLKKSNKDLC